jgi:hypothetical protein
MPRMRTTARQFVTVEREYQQARSIPTYTSSTSAVSAIFYRATDVLS